MSRQSELLESIAETIANCREGAVQKPTPDYMDTWVKQFERDVQKPSSMRIYKEVV